MRASEHDATGPEQEGPAKTRSLRASERSSKAEAGRSTSTSPSATLMRSAIWIDAPVRSRS